uniref:Cytochrome c oxidase subunit 3 n=1 Tax=Jakoba bahamiensis TaxID=221721 RepID=M4Q9V6_9EUKA|nr:cytochrome c oxidase subunit III [Jakoba bahamiensis]AGH24151.1 cytochrome c oxidase subunit 3 [Jakoba bahamiensis]
MSQVHLKKHPFHIVDPSPWPLLGALSAFCMTTGGVLYMHSYAGGGYVFLLGLTMFLYTLAVWSRDIVRESTYQGHHTVAVQRGLRYGMLLFIVSEVMFFVAFFWGFFHSSLSPSIEIGAVWPPKGIEVFNAWDIPFLNTLILLLSGATVTWSHHAMIHGNRTQSITGLVLTVLLAVVFTSLQAFEYYNASFSISDGIYGSTFYMATGFHGFHVFVGTCFLSVCLLRQLRYHFTTNHHFGFEAAAWYWHFVDVVWLFLFVSIYWWGSA